jgi:hypothetical protein
MQAIEFITKAKDGVIEVPQEYREALAHEIRVIILIDSSVKPKSKKKFSSLKVNTKELKFDRDEANER